MKHRISADDRDFLRRFSCCGIEVAGFHHREHVRLAYIFLVLYGVEWRRLARSFGLPCRRSCGTIALTRPSITRP